MKHFFQQLKKRKPLRRPPLDVVPVEDTESETSDSEWSGDEDMKNNSLLSELQHHGLESHLLGQVCRKTPIQAKSTMNRYVKFLFWLSLKTGLTEVLYLIYMLVLEHYVLLPGE
jgi:hypothetical protein